MRRFSSLNYRFFLACLVSAAFLISMSAFFAHRLHNNFSIMTSVVGLTALNFFVLYAYFYRTFIKPLDHLIATSKKLASDNDLNRRAKKQADDKIGELVDAFNHLVSQVQLRETVILSERNRVTEALQQAGQYSEETHRTNQTLAQQVDERKKAEFQLVEFQTFLAAIIDSMPSALVAIDEQLKITQWNQEATRLTHNSEQSVMGHAIGRALPMLEEQNEWISSVWDDNQSKKLNDIVWVVDDQIRHFDIVIYPLRNTEKRYAVLRIDDITEKRKIEEAIIRSEKVLSLGGMAAGMAHEINNPLSAIIQNVQNIERRIDEKLPANQTHAANCDIDLAQLNQYLEKRKVRQFLNNISDAGLRASAIVNNMLQFSRGAPIELQPCLVVHVLSKAINIATTDDLFNVIQDNFELNIDQNFQAPDVQVLGVFTELQQVMLNLIKNAAYAINERHLTLNDLDEGIIQIELTRRQQDAIIRVADNGIGMTEKTRRQAFEPFFTTREIGHGTGLGLSVSYFIINTHHNGKMHIESEYGSGTVFEISLPIHTGA